MDFRELLTTDVWDTVLRRHCHPDAAKLHVARTLLILRPDQVVAPYREARALLALRLVVERDLGRQCRQDPRCDDEYSHADVLREWLTRAGGSACGGDAALLAELTGIELAHEAFVSYVDATAVRTLKTWRVHSRRLLFLSDFYWPSETLAALLHQKIPGLEFDGGLTSADQGVNKRSGCLYQRIQKLEGVKPGQHRHLGDHAVTDVAVPAALGIEAHRHLERAEESRRRRHLRDFAAPREHVRRLDRECRKRLQRSAAGPDIGALAASAVPVFAGFALFVAECARRDAVEKLFFLTREGEFLRRVFAALVEHYPAMAATLPPTLVLEVSRVSTFGPSLAFEEPGGLEAGLELLWKGFPNQSPLALAATLDADADSMRRVAARRGVDPDQIIRGIARDPQVREMLRDREFREPLVDGLRRRRSSLQQYLREAGFAGCERIGIVDLGWRGSMQDYLSRLVPGPQSFGYYLGLQPPLHPPAGRTWRQSYGPDPAAPPDPRHDRLKLFAHLPTLELLCTSATGSVSGHMPHVSRPGATAAIREPMLPSQQQWYDEIAAPWQAAVIDGVAEWAQAVHSQALGSEDLRDLALRRWSQLVNLPPGWLRRALGRVEQDERFGRGRVGAIPPSRRGLSRWLPP